MTCRWLICLILVVLSAGCSPSADGPQRHSVTGSVTFQGKPVPAGMVRFSPNNQKGNHGPGAIAEIKDGRFATLPSKGAVAGPMTVYIEGFDGIRSTNNPDLIDYGAMLFQTFKTEIEISNEDAIFDFEVPAQATKPVIGNK